MDHCLDLNIGLYYDYNHEVFLRNREYIRDLQKHLSHYGEECHLPYAGIPVQRRVGIKRKGSYAKHPEKARTYQGFIPKRFGQVCSIKLQVLKFRSNSEELIELAACYLRDGNNRCQILNDPAIIGAMKKRAFHMMTRSCICVAAAWRYPARVRTATSFLPIFSIRRKFWN